MRCLVKAIGDSAELSLHMMHAMGPLLQSITTTMRCRSVNELQSKKSNGIQSPFREMMRPPKLLAWKAHCLIQRPSAHKSYHTVTL